MNNNEPILLDAFAVAGYRSFGETPQRFERLAKVNLLIGQNNSGKSNVLRLLQEHFARSSNKNRKVYSDSDWRLSDLDMHMPNRPKFQLGIPMKVVSDDVGQVPENYKDIFDQKNPKEFCHLLRQILEKKSEIDETNEAWFYFDGPNKLVSDSWEKAFGVLDDYWLQRFWSALTGHGRGSREAHWFPETLRKITPNITKPHMVLIPAIRQVGKKGSISEGFDGEGIIERLVKLQNPDVHNQQDKQKFEAINQFLQNVTDNKTARIEIPHERDTILVHMDRKTLPLESLGTGIHEVIILASAATILENYVVCIEEPEIHLNPILQKKFVRYLAENTNNQYFITTHSAALMDTPDAEIYHISLQQGQSIVERVTSDRKRSAVCEDLGYHPSDLLQANCVIWVEGPSDRIYLNYWLNALTPQFVEGIHYSIMFYGGRLASHLCGSDIDADSLDDFISLRRLNRRGVIVMDSDRANNSAHLNNTKLRLRDKFDQGPGHAWITEGREIENYLPTEYVKKAIEATIPSATVRSKFGKFENTLSITRQNSKKDQAPKTEIAKYITKKYSATFEQHDLREQLDKLIRFIQKSNPVIHAK
ncbi:AAA family ATPase [Methylomagnum sp.]